MYTNEQKRYGNCNVPNNYPTNQPLSHWVVKQRQQYKLYCNNKDDVNKKKKKTPSGGGGGGTSSSCQLTEERVQQLNDIGFDWRYNDMDVPAKKRKRKNMA